MFHFDTSWKYQKAGGFLAFLGAIEIENWFKMW